MGEGEKFEEFEFEMNEVYCIDVVMSTGDGKGKETELRNTVYKRAVETNYGLKTQKARQFISEVNRRFPALPFTLRAIEDMWKPLPGGMSCSMSTRCSRRRRRSLWRSSSSQC